MSTRKRENTTTASQLFLCMILTGLTTMILLAGIWFTWMSTQDGIWRNEGLLENPVLGFPLDHQTYLIAFFTLASIASVYVFSILCKHYLAIKSIKAVEPITIVCSEIFSRLKSDPDADDLDFQAVGFVDYNKDIKSSFDLLNAGVISLRTDYEEEKNAILADLESGFFSKKIEVNEGLWMHFTPSLESESPPSEVVVFEDDNDEFILKVEKVKDNTYIGVGSFIDRPLRTGALIKIMDQAPLDEIELKIPLFLRWRNEHGEDIKHQRITIRAKLAPGSKMFWVGEENIESSVAASVEKLERNSSAA